MSQKNIALENQQALQSAVAYHQAGQLNQAKAIYEQVLQKDPQNANALHLLGLIAHGDSDYSMASDLFRKAIKSNPTSARFRNSYGETLANLNQFEEAMDCFEKALQLDSKFFSAYLNIGNIFHKQGNLDRAIESYMKATQEKPDYAVAYNNLGNVFKDQKKIEEAIKSYKKALQINPNYYLALYNLGVVLESDGKAQEAIDSYQKAIIAKPDLDVAHHNLGNVYKEEGKLREAISSYEAAIRINPNFYGVHHNLALIYKGLGEADKAIASFKEAIRINPADYNSHCNLLLLLMGQDKLDEALTIGLQAIQLNPTLRQAHFDVGTIYFLQHQFDKAIASFEKAIELEPDDAESYNNLGSCLYQHWNLSKAAACCRKALELKPHYSKACHNLATILRDQGKLTESTEYFRKAIQFDPNFRDSQNGLLFNLLHYPNLTNEEVFKEHLQWAKDHADFPPLFTFQNNRDPKKRLRIGYVSPDFFKHVNARIIEPLLVNHDRSQFEIFCYSNTFKPDATTSLLKDKSDHWREILTLSDIEAAKLIQKDQIDILVDLVGHTTYNRLILFAYKPAPVQVTFLGYAATTGLKTIDYRLTDNYGDPTEESQSFYTEKLLRIPGSIMCYTSMKDTPDVYPLPAINKGYITFASLNALIKINSEVIQLWSKILEAVPHSKLLLRTKGFGDPSVKEEIYSQFESHGISRNRLDLREWSKSNVYQIFEEIDICLDPFPFNGGATTFDSLWMGVPAITLAGDHFVSRMGLRYMSILGLEQWIAQTRDQYVEIAVRASHNLEELKMLRTQLRENLLHSSLMDQKSFVRNIEASYRKATEELIEKI